MHVNGTVRDVLLQVKIIMARLFKKIDDLVAAVAERSLRIQHAVPVHKIDMVMKSLRNAAYLRLPVTVPNRMERAVLPSHHGTVQPGNLHAVCLGREKREPHVSVLHRLHTRRSRVVAGAVPFRPGIKLHLQIGRVKKQRVPAERLIPNIQIESPPLTSTFFTTSLFHKNFTLSCRWKQCC